MILHVPVYDFMRRALMTFRLLHVCIVDNHFFIIPSYDYTVSLNVLRPT